jgi:hypothetical protein
MPRPRRSAVSQRAAPDRIGLTANSTINSHLRAPSTTLCNSARWADRRSSTPSSNVRR